MGDYSQLLQEIESNLNIHVFLFFVCAFVISLFLIPKIRAIAFKLNIQDLPNDRSSHSNPVPTFGGVPVFQPDRNHIHHIIIDFGLSHRGASFCIGVVNFSIALIMFYVITNFSMVAPLFILVGVFMASITLLFLRNKNKSAVRLKRIMKTGDVNNGFLLDGLFIGY